MTSIISPGSSIPALQMENGSGLDIVAKFTESSLFKLDGNGDDSIVGGRQSDIIEAGGGNDIISSGSGDDIIKGEAGNDIIKAGSGDDVITGGAGSDSMTGGMGDDKFIISASDIADGSVDIISDFTLEGDSILFQGIGANAQVSYDANSGVISINGKDVLKIDEDLDIGSDDITNTGGDNWEIF